MMRNRKSLFVIVPLVVIAGLLVCGAAYCDDQAQGQATDLSICIAIDCSGDMSGEPIGAVQQAILRRMPAYHRPGMEWSLVSFSGCECREHAAFTQDAQAIVDVAGDLAADGERPLTYAIYKSLAYLAANGQGAKGRLVVLAAGTDTCPDLAVNSVSDALAGLKSILHEGEQAGDVGAYSVEPAAGETTQDAMTDAQQAVASTDMEISLTTIGFDIAPASEAEQYLRQAAEIGAGGYFVVGALDRIGGSLKAAVSGETTLSKQDGPIVVSPRNGQIAGPATEIIGHAERQVLLKIWTDVHAADTNEKLRSVPGIRHKTKDNGDFHFRIATPRVSFGERDTRLRYEIHVRAIYRDHEGPETIVNMYSE